MAAGLQKPGFHPLETRQLIEKCFNQILATAAAIRDPFAQALFAMAQWPYPQPFDDVNRRVSRPAANTPLIKTNLTPLSLTKAPVAAYTDAVFKVYEFNRVDLLKAIFIRAHERSVARCAAVRQSLGLPPFRLKHRKTLRDIAREIVLERPDRQAACPVLPPAPTPMAAREPDQCREIAEN